LGVDSRHKLSQCSCRVLGYCFDEQFLLYKLQVFSMYSLLFSALLLLASPAWAAPIDDAAAANARGDYTAELRITRPLAAKGEAWAQSLLGLS